MKRMLLLSAVVVAAAAVGDNVAGDAWKELKKQKDLNDCFHMRIHLSLCKDLLITYTHTHTVYNKF